MDICQTLSNGTAISYTYDASGNRVSKPLSGGSGYTEWYVRDAQGNVLGIYRSGDADINSGALSQIKVNIYGSSRLGALNSSLNCTSLGLPTVRTFIRGNKLFELTDHRGNVLVQISDKKLQHYE